MLSALLPFTVESIFEGVNIEADKKDVKEKRQRKMSSSKLFAWQRSPTAMGSCSLFQNLTLFLSPPPPSFPLPLSLPPPLSSLTDYSPDASFSDTVLQGCGYRLNSTAGIFSSWQKKYFILYPNRLEWADSLQVLYSLNFTAVCLPFKKWLLTKFKASMTP